MANKGNVGTLSFGVNINLKKFKRQVQQMVTGLTDFTKKAASLGAASAAGIGAITIATARSQKELNLWADRLGIARQEFAALAKVGGKFGVDIDTVGDSIKDLNERIADASTGNKTYEEALNMIGLSYKNLENLSPTEQFLKVGDAIGKLNDVGKQNFVTAELMADAGFRLLPAFREGEKSIRAMTDAVIENNEVLNPQQSAQLDVLWSAFNQTVTDFKSTIEALAAEFAPLVTLALDFSSAIIKSFRGEAIAGVKDFTETTIELARNVIPELAASFWAIWESFKIVISNIFSGFKALGINSGNTVEDMAENFSGGFLQIAKFFGSFRERLALGFLKMADMFAWPFVKVGQVIAEIVWQVRDKFSMLLGMVEKVGGKVGQMAKEARKQIEASNAQLNIQLNRETDGLFTDNLFKEEADILRQEIEDTNKKIEATFQKRVTKFRNFVEKKIDTRKQEAKDIASAQESMREESKKAAAEIARSMKNFASGAISGSVEALKIQFGSGEAVQKQQLATLGKIEKNTRTKTVGL